ncbi:MAG: hypothetical protein SO373_08825 [Candidatus Borkfalkiaceae bacterium]|nr:hypothetical protein [Christensenellaceae bacterium]
MKKLFISILSAICLITLCAGLSACAGKDSLLDDYVKKGYVVTVKYDASGGGFLGSNGSYFVDMFNPSKYTKEADGSVKIKLIDPVDSSRKISNLQMTKDGKYFNVGWYLHREEVKNEYGNYIDENGKEIYFESVSGLFYTDDSCEKRATPAYKFSDPWDFENDRITAYDNGELQETTLYAAWLPYFTFTYYVEVTDENGNTTWQPYGTQTSFDYVSNKEKNGDLDVCYLPDWSDTMQLGGETVKCGYMEYSHKYTSMSGNFVFPKLDDDSMQFAAAYEDEGKTKKIDGVKIQHGGSIDFATATAVNPDKKIYVEFKKGVEYKVNTAKMLSEKGDADGLYEILCDLDFSAAANGDKQLAWPSAFENGTFTGTFNGNGHKISGVTAKHNTADKEYGGLFGRVAVNAVIKNVTFVNTTFDLISSGKNTEGHYGAFSGYIEKGATVTNVKMENTEYRISSDFYKKGFDFSLISGGDSDAVIENNGFLLVLYGKALMGGRYDYKFDCKNVGLKDDKIVLIYNRTTNDTTPEYKFKLENGELVLIEE